MFVELSLSRKKKSSYISNTQAYDEKKKWQIVLLISSIRPLEVRQSQVTAFN